MNATIALKGFKPLARKVRTQTAVRDAFFVRAGSDLAVCAARVDVKRIRAAALTGESQWVVAPASRFRAQTLPRVEQGPVMVAGPTVESARRQ
jgi:hypothetical protein